VKGLAIKEVAERTGIAAATIRVWEQRYGFPSPERTPSGYRVYSEADVEALRRVAALRERGLSVGAAVERARAVDVATDSPSIFGAIIGEGSLPARRLRKATLIAISRGIEDETLARAARPVVVGAFQAERHFRRVEHRYRRLARVADACAVFADFARVGGEPGGPVQIPIGSGDALGNEWAVVIDAPGYAACLVAWETAESQRDSAARPERERQFETVWTLDPRVVRRAALAGAALVARSAPAEGERMERLLQDRPLALESPAPALTALTNRIVGYLDGS
jgi:MerR family transcriptional regulator, light-induced transcriptional regulator